MSWDLSIKKLFAQLQRGIRTEKVCTSLNPTLHASQDLLKGIKN